MNQRKIGVFLKELRGERGLTQEQLAERLGVSRRAVSRWETGSNMLVRICGRDYAGDSLCGACRRRGDDQQVCGAGACF